MRSEIVFLDTGISHPIRKRRAKTRLKELLNYATSPFAKDKALLAMLPALSWFDGRYQRNLSVTIYPVTDFGRREADLLSAVVQLLKEFNRPVTVQERNRKNVGDERHELMRRK